MDPNYQQSLLAELDARQDDVLEQLDELNRQIEALLSTWLVDNRPEEPAGESAEKKAA